MSSGWWYDLPAAAAIPAHVWLGLPAAAIGSIAIAASAWSAPRLIVMALAISAFVHPWLPVALAALLAGTRPRPTWQRWALPAGCAVVTGAAAIALTPACLAAPSPMAWTDIARLAIAGIGLTGATLVIFDVVFGNDTRRAQAGAMVAAVVAAALAATGRLEGTAAMGVILSILWWRAASGGRHVLRWQSTAAARTGAALLLAAVLVIAIERVVAGRPEADPTTNEVWRALDATSGPVAMITTGGRADVAAAIWRAQPGSPRRDLALVPEPPEPGKAAARERLDPFSSDFALRALLAWPQTSAPLRTRGYVVGPMAPTTDEGPVLSRVLDSVPCLTLTATWRDVHELAGAQVAGLFPEIAPLRGALLYATSRTALTPQPVGWPANAVGGFEARAFDRSMPADAAALTEALTRDELDANALGSSRHVVRVRFDRRAMAPEALPITFGGATDGAWARRYARDDETPVERRPSLCRDTSGQVVVAFEGAATTANLDLNSPHVAGRGWHESGARGRTMAGAEADLLFLAGQPRPLRLELEADPSSGDWTTTAMRVTLNGVEAGCLDGSPPCDWLLPADVMRRGLNVVTLHVTAPPGAAGNATSRGLLVHRARLHTIRVAR